MAITLGSNIASLQAQRQLFHTEQGLSSVFERLSSGQRINRASDDAAGLAISESLNTDGRVYTQAVRNLSDGASVINIADSTLAELSGIVIRIQELAEQSANGTFSSEQRASIDVEAQALNEEYVRITETAEFNGLNLLGEALPNGLRLQAGYGLDGSILVQLEGGTTLVGDGTFQDAVNYASGASARDLQVADLNGDGALDLVTANNSGTGNDLSILLGNNDGTFGSASSIDTGDAPDTVALGDLNGDGRIDILVADLLLDSGKVYLGNGDGTFGSTTTVPLGDGALDLVLVDIDDDDDLDILSANLNGDNVSIHLGNGNGTFAVGQNFSAGDGPHSVEVADFDGDGNLDFVAVTRHSNEAVIRLGNGNGTFQASQAFDVSNWALDVAIGDYDGDGEYDLAVSHFTSTEVVVLLGNGNGTFQAGETFFSGDKSFSIRTADLNSDGVLDLVTTNLDDDSMTVLLGNGDGTFQAAETYSAGNGPRGLQIADVTGDGVAEILVSNGYGSSVSIYVGNSEEAGTTAIDPLSFSLSTRDGALTAMEPLRERLELLSQQRGSLGSALSRIEVATNILSATSENYAAAESRIKDADIAFESSQLTRLNILQQAAAAVLGQANQQPALTLQLLN